MTVDHELWNGNFIEALVLDLGDVLFNWSLPTNTNVNPEQLRRAMNSLAWHDLERGKLSEDECLENIIQSRKLPVSAQDLKETLREASLSLTVDGSFVASLRNLKSSYNLKVFAMSNIALAHYQILRDQQHDIWTLFDGIFISAEVGMRKPDLEFYRHVLQETGLSAPSIVFVDDKAENTVAAQSLGMHAVRFTSREETMRILTNKVRNPVYRGDQYLRAHAKKMHGTVNGADVRDNFVNLNILDATGNMELVEFNPPVAPQIMWNYFAEPPSFTTKLFPNDFDTSSLAALVLGLEVETAHQLMDKALGNMNRDGIIQVYEDPNRPRVDHVCSAHMMAFFIRYGRSNDVLRMWEWLYNILLNRAHLIGSYYYHLPDYYLWSMSRIAREAANAGCTLPGKIPLFDLVRERCRERLGVTDNALALGLRLMACQAVGVPFREYEKDLKELVAMQCEDGGWPLCEIYKVPLAKTAIASRGMTTAFAVKVLKDAADYH
ncbi:hypothetical protein AA313_de0202117 [Arthrobotrys entomopaga]|nr:hypothetical protein AA313_de0202117 [Arthrobotrys entomopaga]